MPVLSLLAHKPPLLAPNFALHYHREPTYLEALAEDWRAQGTGKLLGALLTFPWADISISSGASAPVCPDLQ